MLHYLNKDNSEHSISSPEQVEEYLQTYFLAIDQSEPWRLKNTHDECCSPGNATESCHDSQSGMMSAPSTENHGEDELMLFAVDSLAKTYQQQEKAQELLMAQDQDYGLKCPESFAKYDRDMYLWKTAHFLPLGDLELFLETWPKWGLMRNGECFAVTTPADFTEGAEFGFWPTPTKSDSRNWISTFHSLRNPKLSGRQPLEIHPNLHETLMGWPIEWTDLQQLEMDKFQQWLHLHGVY